MQRLMKTGVAGLDRILCGGFLYHNSILLKGAPGCGKTTLGLQIVLNGATLCDEPGVAVLFEQFPQQLYRDLSGYGWDIEGLVRQDKMRVIFSEPEQVVSRDKVVDPPLISRIQDAAAEVGAKRIVIDSVSHILNVAPTPHEARVLLLRFINCLKSIGLTPIMTAEAEDREGSIGIEEYLSDCVLRLTGDTAADRSFQIRELTVLKTRGHDHLRGRHAFRLTDQGVAVFPRFVETPKESIGGSAEALSKLCTGIIGLDEMLGGGYTRGTSTIVAGMPGTFKTTLGVQFLVRGAAPDEKGILVSLSERPDFLASLMQEKGLPLAGHVARGSLSVIHAVPKHVYMEEILHRLEAEFRKGGVTRLVVDGVNEIERGTADPQSYKDIIASFLLLCSSFGVTALFTQKMDEYAGNEPLAGVRYASMFDGIIFLGTLEIESAVHKVISVLKMRGGSYSTDLREITCDAQGLTVLDKFVGLSGILSGNVQGQYKRTVEELFQPLYFVRDFIDMLASGAVDEEQRAVIVGNLQSEVGKLVEKLKTHFDVK